MVFALLQGCKVFCLQYVSVATIDVPQSSSMNRYLEKGDLNLAYQVACLGVTDSDWRTLAAAALQVHTESQDANACLYCLNIWFVCLADIRVSHL